MCGICGIVTSGRPQAGDGRVESLATALRHRGPDAVGQWRCGRVALGHTRLAIIDLDPSANQPFLDERLGLAIVYNGEIYNYRELRDELRAMGYHFRTQSDTEVLLAAWHRWGTHAFTKLVGMWTFAITSIASGEVVLCRDRFGIKPLYYARVRDELVFSSELRAFFAANVLRASANSRVVSEFLASGNTDSSEETFYDGVRQLPAGSFLRVAPGTIDGAPETWWRARDYATPWVEPTSYGDAVAAFRGKFAEAIRLHLRSDVTVGMCLSGGLDSSAIAGTVGASLGAGAAPRSFSAVFPGESYDESPYVDDVVAMWGLDATRIHPSFADFGTDIDAVVRAQEEPFASTGVYLQWKLFQAIGASGLKVVLDGQGSDEYLAGYLTFLAPYVAGASSLRKGERMLASYVPLAAANARALSSRFGGIRGLVRRVSARGSRDGGTKIIELMSAESREYLHPAATAPVTHGGNGLSPLKHTILHYLTHRSLPALLRYEDRNSMAFSIESRVPFLDHRLVEFALGAPDDFLIRGGRTKAMLRDAARPVLPARVYERKLKLGFASPQEEWTRKVILPRIAASLDAPSVSAFFDRQALASMVGNGNGAVSGDALWRVYSVMRWHDLFSVS